jgi:hypothetical protein
MENNMKSLILLLLTCISVQASTVTFSWTNWDGTVSTNDLVITYARQPNSGDGRTAIKGLPRRYPTVNGNFQTNFAVGFYTVIPYDMDDLVQPILFEVPNDSQTYNFWSLRRSFGNYFDVTGVLGLTAGQGITLSPTNGVGFVTVSAGSGASNVFVNAGSNAVQVVTNSGQSLFTVSLAFMPMIASAALSNYATVGTNYWYPSNNPSGFITAAQVVGLLGYQTNAVTTNNPTGMTNVIRSIAGSAGSLAGLSDVGLGSLGANQALRYNSLSGKWTNDLQGTVTSVSASVPAELAVSGVPITSAGTIAITKANQAANQVWAGPTTGSPGQPTFRALVAADIPATVSTIYASNVVSGGQLPESVIASNATANGQFLINTNSTAQWSFNGGSLTNLQSANLIGNVPAAVLGTGSADAGKFLRGDRAWANVLPGPFTISGQLTNTGNFSLDNGAVLSDGAGTVKGLKWVGQLFGQGFGITNVSATNLINVLADARISNNIPRLETINVFANNNLFQSSVEFDGGVAMINSAYVSPTFTVGSAGVIGSSNRFQVVNSQGRNLIEAGTNGFLWLTTNHLYFMDWDGSVYNAGNSNHFVHQVVSDSQIAANSFFSQNFYGSGQGLSNLNLSIDPNQFLNNGSPTMLHLKSGATVTNLQHYGEFDIYPSGIFSINGWQFTNNIVSGELTILKPGGAPIELVESVANYHKFNDSIVASAASNRVTGIITVNNLAASTITNLASGGSKIQATDANGKLIDTTDGSTLLSLNASQLSSGTVPNARFPALGSVYADALTNNDTRATIRLLGTSNYVAGTMNEANLTAGTITNRASTGGKLAAYDANGKLIDVLTIAGGTFSGTTLTVNGSGTGWNTTGNSGLASDGTAFLGTTDAVPLFLKVDGVTVGWFGPTGGSTQRPDIILGGGKTTLTNQITSSSPAGNIIAGGDTALIQGSSDSGIFAGSQITIQTNSSYTVVLGGATVLVHSNTSYSASIGASSSELGFNGPSVATLNAGIFGGINQTNRGNYSVVVGGNGNLVTGQRSFAGGNRSKSSHDGTFVWSDSQDTDFTDAGQDSFNIRATNGFRLMGPIYATNISLISPDIFYTNKAGANQWMKLQNGNLSVGGTISGSFASIAQSSLVSQYATNIASHFADQGNSTTSDTTLYSDTIPASTLSANGQKIYAQYALNTVNHATATRQIKVFFAGTSILDTGALVFPSVAGNVDIDIKIIRDSSTSIRQRG